MSSPEYTHDLMNEIINSILVEDNRFIWNFSYSQTETQIQTSALTEQEMPPISIDGEIMGTPRESRFYISEEKSLNLLRKSAIIRCLPKLSPNTPPAHTGGDNSIASVTYPQP